MTERSRRLSGAVAAALLAVMVPALAAEPFGALESLGAPGAVRWVVPAVLRPGADTALVVGDADGISLGRPAGTGWSWERLAGGAGWPEPVITDLDADGDADLVDSRATGAVLLQEDDGRFTAAALSLAGRPDPGVHVLLADDVNDDGFGDLFVAGAARSAWWLRDPDGSDYRAMIELPPAVRAWCTDLDGDGGRDLLARHPDGTVSVRRRQAVGFDAEPVALPVEDRIAAVGDLDGDGDADLLTIGGDGLLGWWRNRGTGFEFDPQRTELSVAPGAGLVLRDLDRDGLPDIVDSDGRRWLRGRDRRIGPGGDWQPLPGAPVLVEDLDADGDFDLLTAAGGVPGIHRHAGNRNGWLGVRLRPRSFDSGRGALMEAVRRDGARLRATAERNLALTGLDRLLQIDLLLVYWPSGAVSRIELDGVNRYVAIAEPPRPEDPTGRLRKPGTAHRFWLPGALECR